MMMRRITVLENLKNFIVAKPPAVLFLVCLFSFIVVLSSFIEFLKTSDTPIPNPDELDWNAFRLQLSQLDFCLPVPGEIANKSAHSGLTSLKQAKNEDKNKNSYSYETTFNVDFTGPQQDLEQVSVLVGEINLFLLGLKKENLDIEFHATNIAKLQDDRCNKNLLTGKTCDQYIVKGCITLTGLSQNFPKTKAPSPNQCLKSSLKTINSSNLFYKSEFTVSKETPEMPAHFQCSSNAARARLAYARDPSLVAILTQIDKDLICRNLSIVIFALTILISTIILYALCSNSRKKSNFSYSQVI